MHLLSVFRLNFSIVCLSYISTVRTRHHKESVWGLRVSEVSLVHDHHGGEHSSRQAGMALEQELRAHILGQPLERANW